ncbi:MAG: ABC transporter ATP-binding protein [Rhodospirillales bacterium]|nr:ABC transporter ATP-binding protein [Rhodospirillales bacterium]|tara:strand:- start:8 stop:736 length:729 start_codon:yes stop_codon:yes gene_type:complete
MAAFLEIENVSKSFRGLKAVSNVSLNVEEGGMVALIGPNGAGKTTLFNLIAGVFPADEGRITLAGNDILGLRPDQICDAGISRTFQLVKPFPDMTVLENVTVGALHGAQNIQEARKAARNNVELLDLANKIHLPAHSLTLPDRKRLEVARALATRPKLLLLDEVMAGLRPTETDEMVAVFKSLNQETGITILLIEHVMRAVMSLSHHVAVLHHGKKISEGTPGHITQDPEVLDCYLGEEEDV